MVASTVEPEWDDAERDKMLGLELYEGQVCGTCGVHPTRATKDNHYDVTSEACELCAGLTVRHRQYAAEDEKEEEALKDLPADERAAKRRRSDGRKIRIREISAEEAAQLVAERNAPLGPAAVPAPTPANKGPRRTAERPKEG